MKKIVLFLILVSTLVACTTDYDGENYHYEVLPVDSYTVPESFILGKTYEIKLKYKRPSDCHYFQGIYYSKDLNIRTIGIQTMVMDKQNCAPLDIAPVEVSFNFYATTEGSYIFKFYKGEDADGKNIFEEVEIPVVNQ